MASARQKNKLAIEFGMFIFELGKIPTEAEYQKFRRVPVRRAQIRRVFGNWAKMLHWLEGASPNLWAEIQALDAPETAPYIDLSAIEKDDDE